MKLLISIISPDEARMSMEGNPDILDIKNPEEGSLGAQFPWILKEVANEIKGSGTLCSATLGDLNYKPGTASLAAYGAAMSGVRYIKAGLFGVSNYDEGMNMMNAIVRATKMADPEILIVASGYADFRRFDGLHYKELVKVAGDSGADLVMVDTAVKDGKTLLDAMSLAEIKEFIDLAHMTGLKVALAGSLKKEHIGLLDHLRPDIIGVRGAICQEGDRKGKIDREKLADLIAYVKKLN